MTSVARCSIELVWRYITDPYLLFRTASSFCFREDLDEQVWDYGFKNDTGKVITGTGTLKKMEIHKAALRRQAKEKEGNDDGHNDCENGHRKA
jgi:hypothetical protein